MDLISKTDLQSLLKPASSPCVSMYLPTQPGGSEQGPIRWKNLLRQAEERLVARGMRWAGATEFLDPLRQAERDDTFWKSQSDGLAAFHAPGLTRFYRLPAAFDETVVVGPGFYVKPLLPLVEEDERFYVLAISRNSIRLFHGTHFSVSEVDTRGMPHSLAEALRFHDTDEPLIFHTHPGLGLGRWGALFHGHGVGIDDRKIDVGLYFQQIDRGLHELLRQERAPLILASVEYLWPLYRAVNTYPHLLAAGIPGSPDRLSPRELHDKAWSLLKPLLEETRSKAVALYAQLAGTGRTSDSLDEVVAATQQGRGGNPAAAARGGSLWRFRLPHREDHGPRSAGRRRRGIAEPGRHRRPAARGQGASDRPGIGSPGGSAAGGDLSAAPFAAEGRLIRKPWRQGPA
jgi:hypothetical protein